MFTLKKYFVFFAFIVFSSFTFGQDAVILGSLDRKLFSLRNSRVTVGLVTHLNYVDSLAPYYQAISTNLPKGYSITYESSFLPSFSAGLCLDWYSPNSKLGLTVNGEYNIQRFNIRNSSDLYEYEFQNIVVPVYLNYKFGDIHARKYFFVMQGGYISQPVGFNRTINDSKVELAGVQQPSFGLSSVLGYAWRLTKSESEALAKSVLEQLDF